MTKPGAITSHKDNRSHPKASEHQVVQVNDLLYFFECLSKDYTHKIRSMVTYERKVEGPIVEQRSCFLRVVRKPACSLAT